MGEAYRKGGNYAKGFQGRIYEQAPDAGGGGKGDKERRLGGLYQYAGKAGSAGSGTGEAPG